jgi:hypothetical protein
MTDAASWASVLVGVAILVVGYITYRNLHGKTRLEYVVVSNARVVPSQIAAKLDVIYGGARVADASVAIIRLVNTGDKAILAEHFSSPLGIRLDGVNEVVAAMATKTRPADLHPLLSVKTSSVLIAPLLINPGDLIQLQLLSSGLPSGVTVEGRIANVGAVLQRGLPYAPGSGPEGELRGFDTFMWYVAPMLLGVVVIYLILTTSMTPIARVAAVVVVLLLSLLLNMYLRFLDRRRGLWRP